MEFSNCVITIGNFDGCHLGHKKLIETNRILGKKFACPNVVLSFFPRPQDYLAENKKKLNILLTTERKTRALKELGAGFHYVLTFNKELSLMSHVEFYEFFLRDYLKVRAITVGENFHFGFQRKGTAHWLKQRALEDHIHVEIIPSYIVEKEIVSSTLIRTLLTEKGDVERVKLLLGHRFSIEGLTIQGAQLGRKIGFPTLNIKALDQLIPAEGVYCGYVWLEGLTEGKEAPVIQISKERLLPAVFSIGTRPTFSDSTPTVSIEAHLLDNINAEKDHYHLKISFYFEKKIRDMMKFKDKDELVRQISQDIDFAKKLL